MAKKNKAVAACPHCGKALTWEEISSVLDALGQSKRVRTRQNPRAYEAMPVIISQLKEHSEGLRTPDLRQRVQEILARRGFAEKPLAINFALTYLKKEGFLEQPAYAKWRLTSKGDSSDLSEDLAREISNRCETEYRERKRSVVDDERIAS